MKPEILRPKGTGISGILELARMVTPPDHEFIGFEDGDGLFLSYEQLKALEGQENQMDSLQKVIDSLESKIKRPQRTVKRCFHFNNSFIAIASDDTVWYLTGEKTGERFWNQLQDAAVPPLPQEGSI